MSVLSEEKLTLYLDRVIALSGEIVPLLSEFGTAIPPSQIAESYQQLITDLAADRQSDTVLMDETWDWIFAAQESTNLIKTYGRLAWINLQLLELL